MAKQKAIFVCNDCGQSFGKWQGQCSACGSWNSLQEQIQAQVRSKSGSFTGTCSPIQALGSIKADATPRFSSELGELDRVLGGGIVPGSVILIGGDPGVGKSTLLLQACGAMARTRKILYISGEESLQQIAMRARRLKIGEDQLLLQTETDVGSICQAAAANTPAVMVIDSIQTMQFAELQAAPGSVSQVRECAAYLTRFAKQTGTVIFFIGHVTKSGDLAGPRVLEHMIDVVCYIEGGGDSRYRMVRAVKNRFGAVNELGIFAMTDGGMKEVRNPSAIFLSSQQDPLPGSAVLATWEGSRPLLVELQALVDQSFADPARRISMGFEYNRLLMLLAVLHKHGKIASYDKDVFINVVGGIRIAETAADLTLLLAIVSSLKNSILPRDLVAFGEVGLAGELRPVPNGQERLREAAKHGFKTALIPAGNYVDKQIKGLTVTPIRHLDDALRLAFQKTKATG